MKRMIATAVLSLMPFSATAQTAAQQSDMFVQNMLSSHGLATILAGEQACGLTYQPDALAAFVDETVGAENTGFLSTLSLSLDGEKFRMEEMTGSERIVYCRQIERNAQAFGFLAE